MQSLLEDRNAPNWRKREQTHTRPPGTDRFSHMMKNPNRRVLLFSYQDVTGIIFTMKVSMAQKKKKTPKNRPAMRAQWTGCGNCVHISRFKCYTVELLWEIGRLRNNLIQHFYRMRVNFEPLRSSLPYSLMASLSDGMFHYKKPNKNFRQILDGQAREFEVHFVPTPDYTKERNGSEITIYKTSK